MKIYLIRHGQSAWQTNNTTSRDSDITPLGKVQAYYLNKYIREKIDVNVNMSVIYASPLKRSIQTVESLKKKYILEPGICEADFHVAESLPTFDKPGLVNRTSSKDAKYIKFKKEIKNIFNKLISNNTQNDIYLYTHSGVIKTFLRIIHDNDSVCYKIHNCSITSLEWDRSRWHLYSLNDVSFMPKEYIT